MRKVSKISIILLLIAVISSAFCAVAFATDGDALSPVEFYLTTISDGTFSNYNGGDTIDDNESYVGRFIAGASDDGNVYMLSEYSPCTGTSTTVESFDLHTNKSNCKTYNFTKYPYVAFDFDIMTENGTYGNYAKALPRLYSGNTGIATLSTALFSEIGLSTVPYEWQHVTFIVEYDPSGVMKYHYYVNGVHTLSDEYDISDVEAWIALDGDHSNLSVGYYRMYPSRYETKDGKIGMDNFRFTYFPAEYCEGESDFSKIATFYYNSEYELPYKYTVAKVVDSEGNATLFDDINEAISAATATDTVKLFENITEQVVIDKAITIDRNIYGADGKTTGELYSFSYVSSEGFVDTETASGSGIFTFEKMKNAVDVIWDPACEEDCDCYANFAGHVMTDKTVVVLGEIPVYLGEIPTFTVKDGFVKTFVGWSYTKGGEAEPLREITAADVADEVLKLYPVYSAVQYDIEYVDAAGNSEFFFAKDFEETFAELLATDGAKLVLHNDVEYYRNFEFSSNVTSTLDLNGHTLTRINLYGNTYHYDPSTKEYVAGEAVASALNAFSTSGGKKINFTITSSKPDAVFYTASVNGTIWYDESGEISKYEGTEAGYGGFIYAYKPTDSTFNVENITIFAIDILYNSHGTTKNLTLNVDNCNFYKTTGVESSGKTGYGCIYIDTVNNAKVNLKDSLFYIPASTVITGQQQFIRVLEKGTVEVIADNCDIISDNSGVSVSILLDSHYAVFNNCRIYNIKNGSATFPATLGNGTLSTATFAGNSKISEGFALVECENKVNYSLPTFSRVVIDSETKLPSFDFYFAERELVFTYEVKPSAELYASVVWLDESGNIIESSHVLKNSVAIAPRYVVNLGDGYRGIVVTKWLDGSGAISNLEIGQENEYIFKANPVVDNETEYTARITSAQFNLLFYTNFSTLIYLPVDTQMSAPTVSGFTILEHTVKICGTEYWAYQRNNGTTDVTEDYTTTITFTKEGQTFEQKFTVSALLYAEIVLSAPESDIEARAIANMLRYIREARLAAKLDISEKFTKIESLYKLDDYKPNNKYDSFGANPFTLGEYVESISYMIHGSSISCVITLKSGVIDNASVTACYLGSGNQIALHRSTSIANSYYTSGAKVYDMSDKLIEITVSVETESGTKTVIGTHSLGAYINGVDNSLAKAMYEFGVAASTYREQLLSSGGGALVTYKATFKSGDVIVDVVDFNIGMQNISEPEVPNIDGYVGAWEKYVIQNRNITVNAVYTPITYSITYNTNNAYATHTNRESYTVETESFEITAPVSGADVFLGWYFDPEFTQKAPEIIEKGSFGDIVLYGNWNCIHEIETLETLDPTPLRDGYEITGCVKCGTESGKRIIPATKSIKLLAIGNSFSIDALEYFGGILADAGVENITIANLYDAGCTIKEHLSFIEAGTSNYTLYLYNSETKKMVSQGSSADNLVSLEYGLKLDDWDIITMQQASGSSYKPSTYDRLDELVDYVRGYNTTAKLYWHMTWAYDTWHLAGGSLGTSAVMYQGIVDTVAERILTRDDFYMVIPAGTAIENMRTSYVGDNMTRDGYHLNYGYGRYTAALTWFAYICGVDVDGINYVPASYPEIADMLDAIKESVKNAVLNPYKVTESLYPPTETPEVPEAPETPVEPEEPENTEFPTTSTADVTDLTEEDIAYLTEKGYDASKYKVLVLDMEDDTFYNSTDDSEKTTSGSLISQFASTKIFTRSELVVGSIIRLTKPDSSSYKYRAEGWVALDQKNASSDRPASITIAAGCLEIDEEWWGGFYYRAFNIQKTGITLEQAHSVIRIYVPVSD